MKHTPDPVFLIEDFKTADEIERLQVINADLLEVCKIAQVRIMMLEGNQGDTYKKLDKAISRAEEV